MDVLYMARDPPGARFPGKFRIGADITNPRYVFESRPNGRGPRPTGPSRFIRIANHREFLVCVEGASIEDPDNSQIISAGCAFKMNAHGGIVRFPLEDEIPTGESNSKSTTNAAVRATIGFLQSRDWSREGFDRLVIASSNESLVEGITVNMRHWVRNGWFKRDTDIPIKDVELWELLFDEIQTYDTRGLTITFWHINGGWSQETLAHAELAAEMDAPESWKRIRATGI
ncbi:ribonuclease H-like protein [Penicillium verhagenii]|uniref:ribonuclease H-like protein n=1 Tax=Penicillium verhagenii TaxID=1562060 RepID=UPI002545BB9C|nr:ribonuclease H-like protein [Penicillium verhagenii]KAJ5938677.1 ribonuclease H-like protein [Penicillium verhagenii]